jgi:hypothetical protein
MSTDRNLLLRDDPFAPVAPTSMPIQRYAFGPYGMTEGQDGYYVTHADHLASLEAARAEGVRMGLEAGRKIHPLSAEQIFAIRQSIRPGDGWDGDDWDYALTRAVEDAIRSAIRAIDIETALKGAR